ncbi:MAG: hypothetical protein KAG96_03100 [Ichthyobacteriaceae bacterium]|nr:hypothetical protein [Ichthyobacteriaceae bacterium]
MNVNSVKVLLLMLMIPVLGISQSLSTSPYSAFGLGEQKYNGPAESVNMGGLGSIYMDNIHVNPQNPATYSFLSITNLSVGVYGEQVTMKTDTQTEQGNHSGISHLVMGIPMGKFGAAFGIMPTSSTGYDITSVKSIFDSQLATDRFDGNYERINRYTGFGGMNRFFVGTSYSPVKGLSVGVNAGYNFGNLSRTVSQHVPPVLLIEEGKPTEMLYEGNQFQTKEEERIQISAWNFDTGLIYRGDFKEDLKYTVGLTYGFGGDTEINYTHYMYTFALDGYEGGVGARDTIIGSDFETDKLTLPKKGSIGFSIGNYSKWMIGVDYKFADPIDLEFGTEFDGFKAVKSQKYSLGGYFTPKYNSLMSYWDKVTYRAGIKYKEIGLNIYGTNIVDYSVNFGLGLPVGNGMSNINIGGSYGVRGTTDNGLMKEDYFSFVLNMSLGDRWFKKVKYQ